MILLPKSQTWNVWSACLRHLTARWPFSEYIRLQFNFVSNNKKVKILFFFVLPPAPPYLVTVCPANLRIKLCRFHCVSRCHLHPRRLPPRRGCHPSTSSLLLPLLPRLPRASISSKAWTIPPDCELDGKIERVARLEGDRRHHCDRWRTI